MCTRAGMSVAWPAAITPSARPSTVCLLMLAFGACGLASITHPVWASALIYAGAAGVGMVGFVMTFRDYG
jgi:hypothetical protein